MSSYKRGEDLPGIVAGEDLTNAKNRFVKIDSTGRAVLCGAGEVPDGVLENCPDIDKACVINGPGSRVRVEAGAAIALGDFVASDATGRAVVAASGNYIAGRATDGASAANSIMSVWFVLPGPLA